VKVGDLVTLDSWRDTTLIGIVMRIDENQKAGGKAFPYFVAWNTGETDWMRKDFLEVISASR